MSTRPIMPVVRAGAAAVVAVVLLVLAGCGNSASRYLGGGGDTENPMTREQQFAQLMQRPNLDEAMARHNELLDKLKTRLSTELGFPAWNHDPDDISHNSCLRQFNDVSLRDAGTQITPSRLAVHAITAEQWPAVKAVFASVGGEYGFTKPGFTLNGPPPQEFITRLYDHYGAELEIGSIAKTTIRVTSGCHLFAEAKQRGTPRPKPTY